MAEKKEYFDEDMRNARIILAMVKSARDKLETRDNDDNWNEGLWLLEGAIERVNTLAERLDKPVKL